MGEKKAQGDSICAGINKEERLATLRSQWQNCQDCNLAHGRNCLVFGEGNPRAGIMFIGEGPGRDEDRQGKPFVGSAGKLLDKLLTLAGLSREEVYIANVVKCRPPSNRVPKEEECAACLPKLLLQIQIINPQVIVLLGATALRAFFGKTVRITKERGSFKDFQGIRVMPTFHPAALLRDASKKPLVWEDMQAVQELYSALSRKEEE